MKLTVYDIDNLPFSTEFRSGPSQVAVNVHMVNHRCFVLNVQMLHNH